MALCFNILKRQLSVSAGLANVFNHVTVIGGGLMGSGIAQVTAQSGIDVTIVEVNEEGVQKSDANIKSSMQRVAKKLFQNSSVEAEKYLAETMGRLKISTDLQEAVAKSDLVVEAIVENLNTKQKLFAQIDGIAPEHTIFASNTSSIPISEIASVTLRKDRFGGLHFFNPVPVMKLLEIIKTDDLSEESYQKMLMWGKAIGKTCITCKDTPGFVVNRLLVPYLAEAIRMLERRVATAKDIDVAMKLGAGYPMGPLELLDYVGLDTTKFILDGWHKKYPENPLFAPIPMLEKLVAEGNLGKKTGKGFYSYKKNTGSFPIPLHCPYFQPMGKNFSPVLPVEQAKELSKMITTKPVTPKLVTPKPIPPAPETPSEPAPSTASAPAPAPKKPVKMVKVEKVEKAEKVRKPLQKHEMRITNKPKVEEIMSFPKVRKSIQAKMPKNIEEYLRDSLKQAKKSKIRRSSFAT